MQRIFVSALNILFKKNLNFIYFAFLIRNQISFVSLAETIHIKTGLMIAPSATRWFEY